MPKLPVLKSHELVRALNKLGFCEHHVVESHVQFKHSDDRRTTVAVHKGKDVPRGTLKAILKQINVSPEELLESM